MKNRYKILLLVLLFIIGGTFYWRLNIFLTERKFATSLKNRTLLIVIENKFNMPKEVENYYEKNKNLADIFLSLLFKTDKKNLINKSLTEVVDLYGEDYQASRFKNAAKGYGNVVILSDKEASYDNFKKTLFSLSKEDKIVDVLLDLHGGPYTIGFYDDYVSKYKVRYDMSSKSLNLGYVYQTLCYGGKYEDVWLDLGAKVVNGAEGINNFVMIAPERFLYLWTHGKTYSEAVNSARNLEVSIFKILSRVISAFPASGEDIESGRMTFAGDKHYSLK